MSTPLSIPFRRSAPLSPPMSNAIKFYISSKYDQHPDMFTADLEKIDRMRTDAINVKEAHVSGLNRLGAYAAVLWAAGGKFPIDIGSEFTWYPALGYNTERPDTQNNLQFERANVLFNIAALYSTLATTTSSGTEGLKLACSYFCSAAGVLKYIREEILPKLRALPPEDMDVMTLQAVESLMLAQAQECFWQKAVIDGMKDSLIARLAAQVSDFYAQAGDFGIKSDAISSDWLHHMTAKHHHFAGAAQYRAACDCLNQTKYGEEVARLQDALICVNEGLKESRYITKLVISDLQGLKIKVSDSLKRAERDNDIIYLQTVPPKSQLKLLSRACMVSAKIPREIAEASTMLTEGGEYGPPLFQKLVPFAVHVAASIYAERRDRAVNNTVNELEELTTSLRDVLNSLNLPGSLQALERPLGIPQALMGHIEEVRRGGGLESLLRAFDDVAKVKSNDAVMYNEAVELLKAEEAEDLRSRARHGTDRWRRQPSKEAAGKLMDQVEEYGKILRSADSSDKLIHDKIRTFEGTLRLMQGPEQALHDFVPNSQTPKLTPKTEREAQRLRGFLNDVSRVESRRRKTAEQLRDRAKSDDVTSAILAETTRLELESPLRPVEAADFEDLFTKRLSQYEDESNMVLRETTEQEELIEKIKETNASFIASRKVDNSLKEREQALQTLENAYSKYREVIGNLESGRKFYNDLAKLLTRFRDEVKGFTYGRRIEAEQIEVDITSAMSNLRLSMQEPPQSIQQQQQPPPPQQQQPPPQLQQQLQQPLQPSPAPIAPNRPVASTPLPAPQPQRPLNVPKVPTAGVWTPEQGIRFGPPPGK